MFTLSETLPEGGQDFGQEFPAVHAALSGDDLGREEGKVAVTVFVLADEHDCVACYSAALVVVAMGAGEVVLAYGVLRHGRVLAWK